MAHIDSFYVRLQDKVAYFTETVSDTNVLAAIHFLRIKDTPSLGFPNCFQLEEQNDKWMFCADD